MPLKPRVTLGPIRNHYESMLDQLSGFCWEEKMCDITFICKGDDINIHAHSSLLKNVSKLIKDTQLHLLAQAKLFITLEGVLSNTVHILLQFLYIGKIQLKENDADNLHALCQMLKIDFGEEMVSVLNKDNLEIYPQPGVKQGITKPKPVASPSSTYPYPGTHTSPKIPVNIQSPNSLKMTIKTGPSSFGLSKSPHAPLTYSPRSVVIPRKRKVETPTSPKIVPFTPSNPKIFDTPLKFERRASNSSMSSSNSSVIRDTNLYCYCQKPTSKDLIGCDHCPQWYHPACLNLSEDTIKSILNLPAWKCPECEKKSALAKKAKKANQGPMYLPIPNGAKFCEIIAKRLDTWGTDEYEKKGFIPLDRITWVSFNNTGSPSPVPPVEEIPPLPEDLATEMVNSIEMALNDTPEHLTAQPKSKIVQDTYHPNQDTYHPTPPSESKTDRIRPSEVLHKKGVQALKAKLAVEKPAEPTPPIILKAQNPEHITEPAITPEVNAPAIIPPAVIAQAVIPPAVIPPVVIPPAVIAPAVFAPAPAKRGRPKLNKEFLAQSMHAGSVEKPESILPIPQTASRIVGGRPKQMRDPPIAHIAPAPLVTVPDKPRMSTSEAAVERMKNEMKVAAELKLIEEAERIREEAEKRKKEGKLVPNGSKNAGPASRRGRRPGYRPNVKTEIASNDAGPEVPVAKDHLKVKPIPSGRRSSPSVNAPAAATLDEHVVRNIKKEKITDHSMEEILSKDANEISKTKPKRSSKSLSNENHQNNESILEESATNASLEPSDDKPDEENNADSSKNESYDELFFCYICKSIYVSKKALANHQKSAHSK
eukprot:GFUD01019090.1.p1 GENE.GFUD01019090.1~~GFUD01019090.1.p1  ORF type:complete len:821 (+),score=212.40 GFUD01019090.1:59-2521(+)